MFLSYRLPFSNLLQKECAAFKFQLFQYKNLLVCIIFSHALHFRLDQMLLLPELISPFIAFDDDSCRQQPGGLPELTICYLLYFVITLDKRTTHKIPLDLNLFRTAASDIAICTIGS